VRTTFPSEPSKTHRHTNNKLGKPGLSYVKEANHRHVDWFDREYVGDYDDRYISSFDGKASKLVVQAVDDIYDNTTNSTWRRTFIRNVSPLYLRIANCMKFPYHRAIEL